jgi:putative hemolysin
MTPSGPNSNVPVIEMSLTGLTVRGSPTAATPMLPMATHYPVSPEQLPPLDRTAGSYRLRFGKTPRDLAAVQRLRFEVFNRELGEGLAASWQTGMDADPWDELFHHIIIEHVPSGMVVGSYRLQTGGMAEQHGGFYSEAEFDLCRLPRELLRDAVEVGRACVHAEHRNGRVIHLLWRGLAAYLLWNERRYLFGCCSIPTRDPALGLATLRQLKLEGFVSRRYSVAPQRGLGCDIRRPVQREIARNYLPPLFQSYLNLGAEVCGPPAIDADFGTIDFLVLLDLERLDQRTRRTFFRDLPEPSIHRIA